MKPSAPCIWIEIAFVSTVDEKRRGLGDISSTERNSSRATPWRRTSERTLTSDTKVH